jgi:NAD(P)-dependent dehydrogenase (short-subunit alcohol dehydrogenase family)
MAKELCVKSLFITGTSRGIGLEFVKQFLALSNPPKHIFATCRNPDAAKELQDLASKNPNLHVHKLDILDYSSFPVIAKWVEGTLGSDEGLNVLINNAAQYSKGPGGYALPISRDILMNELEVNSVAPLMLTQAFLPLLQKSADKVGGESLGCSRAAIINITSRMGSIDDNTSGGSYCYRTSKCALNMITKSLSVDLKPKGILAAVLHPGWVQTEMGGKGLITTTTSVNGLMNVMAGLDESTTGLMISFKGEKIPW